MDYGTMRAAINKLPKNYLQIFNYNFIVKGRYYKPNTTNPQLVSISDNTYGTVGLYLTPGETYTIFGISTDFTFAYNGTTMTPITSLNNYVKYTNAAKSVLASDNAYRFTFPKDATLMCITVRVGLPTSMLKPMLFKTSDEIHPIAYIPYNYYHMDSITIPQADRAYTLATQGGHNKVTVKTDGTGDFTSFVTAIKSINTSSETNQFDIYVYDDHDIVSELGGQTFIEALTSDSDRVGLTIPAYVNIIGIGRPTLSGKILNTWNCNYNAVKAFSVLELTAGNNKIRNIKITGQNMRYAVHDESNGGKPNNRVEWEDCEFIHYGNTDFASDTVGQWISTCAYGMGSSSGVVRVFTRCKFTSSAYYPFSCHDNADFTVGVYLEFDACEFYNQGGNTSYSESAKVSTYSTGTVENTACFRNCIITNVSVRNEVSATQVNRWRIIGGGNRSSNIANSGITVPSTITI